MDNEYICTVCDDTPEEAECMYDENGEELEAQEYDMCDDIECDSSHSKLIGDWTTTDNKDEAWFDVGGQYYMPDKSGEWAAIENESTVQVVWSKFTARAALCSPCYPGQADALSKGEFLHYALPSELVN